MAGIRLEFVHAAALIQNEALGQLSALVLRLTEKMACNCDVAMKMYFELAL